MDPQHPSSPAQPDNPNQQPVTLTPGTPEYNAHMVRVAAIADPSIMDPKFGGDVDKYVQSYSELQAQFTRKSQELAETKAQLANVQTPEPTTPVETPSEPNPKDGLFSKKEKPAAPGESPDSNPGDNPETAPGDVVTFETLQQEYNSNGGQLTPETRARLEKSLEPTLIDRFLELETAYNELTYYKAAEFMGGAEILNALIERAQTELSPAELEALDQDIADPARMKNALSGLKSRLGMIVETTETPARQPSSVSQTSQAAPTGITRYANQQEMIKDMSDPRYKTDPEFRELVAKRTAASMYSR